MMDHSRELWVLLGVGAALLVLFLYYVIRVERTLMRYLSREDKRVKAQQEAGNRDSGSSVKD